MVGRFLFGMLSGGVLVAGVFVVGAVLFPIAEMSGQATAANTATAPDPSAAPEATTASAPAPQPSTEAEGAVAAAPATEAPAEAPADAPTETALADLPEEAPAASSGVEPAPSAQEPAAAPSPASDVAATDSADAAPAAPDAALAEAPDGAEAGAPVALPTLPKLDPEAAAKALLPPDPAAPALAEAPPLAEPAPEALAPETAAPSAPAPDTAVAEAAPQPLPEPLPEPTPGAMPAPAADGADLPGTPAPDLPGAPPEGLPEPEVAALPAPAEDPASGSTFEPAPGLDTPEGVIVGRLPKVGDTPAEGAEAAAETTPEDPRPLVRFAAPFENPDNKPLLSVVLLDPGTPDLDRAALAALPFPVALALDPLDPATPERVAIYRAGGKEVVMLATGIADGAQASDIEVAFQEMDRGLPEAVAVMDLAQSAFQSSRPLASLVVPVVGAQGRGLLTWDQGLNAADQVARRDDIPAAVIFRDFATGGTDRGAIRRLLDRAVFKAGQDGRVVLAGTASADLVAALLEWTVEGRAATVAFAPVSAVLTVE